MWILCAGLHCKNLCGSGLKLCSSAAAKNGCAAGPCKPGRICTGSAAEPLSKTAGIGNVLAKVLGKALQTGQGHRVQGLALMNCKRIQVVGAAASEEAKETVYFWRKNANDCGSSRNRVVTTRPLRFLVTLHREVVSGHTEKPGDLVSERAKNNSQVQFDSIYW